MDYPIHIDTMNMKLSVSILKSCWSIFLQTYESMSHNIVFILINSADPAEMPPLAAFHLGHHCLPKYLFTSIQNENG